MGPFGFGRGAPPPPLPGRGPADGRRILSGRHSGRVVVDAANSPFVEVVTVTGDPALAECITVVLGIPKRENSTALYSAAAVARLEFGNGNGVIAEVDFINGQTIVVPASSLRVLARLEAGIGQLALTADCIYGTPGVPAVSAQRTMRGFAAGALITMAAPLGAGAPSDRIDIPAFARAVTVRRTSNAAAGVGGTSAAPIQIDLWTAAPALQPTASFRLAADEICRWIPLQNHDTRIEARNLGGAGITITGLAFIFEISL